MKKSQNQAASNVATSKLHKHERKVWYKLDLSAIVYPTLSSGRTFSVYRLSVVLKEPIQPDILQQAVDMTLPRFPIFKTAIHKGSSLLALFNTESPPRTFRTAGHP